MVHVESLSTTEKDLNSKLPLESEIIKAVMHYVWYGVVATSISFGARAIELNSSSTAFISWKSFHLF